MKKIIYILTIALASSFLFTACTEEDIRPVPQHVMGGGASDPK